MRRIGMRTGDISLPAVNTAFKAGVPSGKQPAGLLGGCKRGNGIEKSGKIQVSCALSEPVGVAEPVALS